MKKIIFILCLFVICSVGAYAGTDDKHYNLYKTDNMYTFLKLDTRTGQIWQVHWSTEKDGRAVLPLSTEKLSSDSKDGRFALFPTTNMYNFILLDTTDGRTWQVQWSFKEEQRMIVPIQMPSSNTSDEPSSWDDFLLRLDK
jgi:hypothetical protein